MVVDSRYPIPKELGTRENSIEIGGNCKDVFLELYNRLHPTLGQLGVKKKR